MPTNKKISSLPNKAIPTGVDKIAIVNSADTSKTYSAELSTLPVSDATATALSTKQATLVSGTNIKTVNGTSILGSGDIVITGGGAVDSVNGHTGTVVLTSSDIGAVSKTGAETVAGVKTFSDGIVGSVNSVSITNAGAGTEFLANDGTYKGVSGGGAVNTVVAGTNISVISTDPANPVVSFALGTNQNFTTDAEKTKLANTSGTNTGDENATTLGATLNSSGAATPNDTDFVATALSGGILKKISWTNVKAFLKTYFDTLYAPISGGGGSKQFRITIPGEMVADTSNYQGVFWYNDTGAAITISNVNFQVANAAAGTGAAAAFNVYKSSGTASDGINTSAVNLFTSAVDLGSGNSSATNVPNTTTVEAGRWVSLRCTSSAGATNKASDAQVIVTYS